MTYSITLISPEEKEELAERYAPKVRYEIKSEIFGCCIKLLSDDRELLETWQENFYPMSQNIRSHGRLYVFKDSSCGENTVQFDPYSKTAFLFNFSYYGWIKSHDVLAGCRVLKNIEPAVRPDILGHGIKVFLPCLKERPVIRDQFDAAAEDLGLDLEPCPGCTAAG